MHDMVLKLDDIGRPAWLALMVMSFIVFWPLGLGVLAFLLWSGRMGRGWGRGWSCSAHDRNRWKQRAAAAWEYGGSSGNRAFDEYRDETLRRLENEQREFRSFLERLRLAKDRAEFDQFMADRKSRPAESGGADPGAPQA
jgi:hypothetical protein